MSTFSESGGGSSSGGTGGFEKEQVRLDPDEWTESLYRALREYMLTQIDEDIYEVIGGFPANSFITERMPFEKTIIHFDFDNFQNPVLGFGDNVVYAEFNDERLQVTETEARQHIVNIDIGIWASTQSGGTTARLRALQLLNYLFVGTNAYRQLHDATDIELVSFEGGTFLVETVNDLPVWRVANITLVLRVFSRRILVPQPYVSQVFQEPDLEFSDSVTISTE